MFSLIAKLQAEDGKHEEMQAVLERLVAAVDEHEPGMVAYSLHTVNDDPGVFYFYEQYADEAAQQAHLQHEAAKAVTADLRGLSSGQSEVVRMTQVVGINR